MPRHITWKSIADELLWGNWGISGDSSSDTIKSVTDSRLQLCLLIDIAQSLRVLRCDDFKKIPNYLREIRTNTKKKK